MFDAHPVIVHIIIMAFLIALQLGLVPVQRVFKNCKSFRMTLLENSIILVRFYIITIKDMLDDALARYGAQGRFRAAIL